MSGKRGRPKRIKLAQSDYVPDYDEATASSYNDPDELEEARKSRIRDSNKEFARRMTILQTWSDHWTDYSTREGEAYPQQEARDLIKRHKKIACPISSCGKTFTSIGGLKYHYARCNIERSFKCKVCDPHTQLSTRGELLRHMILSHHDDLPALNTEQEEIANSYFSCENRCDKSKKERKLNAETEAPSSAQRLIKSYIELRNTSRLCSASRTFLRWTYGEKDWDLVVNLYDRKRYQPPEKESAKFRTSATSHWTKVKIGETIDLELDKKGIPSSRVFFTGGQNTASAWLPRQTLNSSRTDLIAIAVTCTSLDENITYRSSNDGEGCIQFWNFNHDQQTSIDSDSSSKNLQFIIAHNYGIVFDMCFCPLGLGEHGNVDNNSTENNTRPARVGLLALACGDGQLRIISILNPDHLTKKSPVKYQVESDLIDTIPTFKVRATACLLPPGVGSSTDYQAPACRSIMWNPEDSQRLIVAGYSNGYVAIFDLSILSPILYTNTEGCHFYRPLKTWIAHGAPVTGVAVSAADGKTILVASGSTDRALKIWNPTDLSSCVTTDRSPITRIVWDFRFRGVVSATDSAFTSFNNRVSYKYPVLDGNHNVTVSSHRSTVWGLANSLVTSSIATSDGAGEVFVLPQLISRSIHKRERSLLSTHSLYSLVPKALDDAERGSRLNENSINLASRMVDSDTVLMELEQEVTTNGNSDTELDHMIEGNDGLSADADFSVAERPVANKPSNFLLPIEHRPVESYSDFRRNFGLEFINYNSAAINPESRLPQSCLRASDQKSIYCDRPCDYPFSSIDLVSWSPNPDTFQYLLSASHVGLCRLDKVQIVEQIYKSYLDAYKNPKKNDEDKC